mgnify:CR=1 FL=1
MRFEFLGTGTSAGVPNIGCDCRVCTSSDPRDQRLRTSAAIRWTDHLGHDRCVLLDAGPDLRAQALRAKLARCDAIFFTHNHVDHTFGLDEIRRFNAVQRAPISLFAEDHTMKFLERVYQHIFDPSRNINDSFVASVIPHRIPASLPPISLHGLRFTPIRLLHGKLPILGFRIDPDPAARLAAPWLPLAYCTDVSGIPPESWGLLSGLSTLVLDCLRHRKHPTHLCVDQALSIADRVAARRTFFIHMSHDVLHAEFAAELPLGIEPAHDGLVLDPLDPIPNKP